MARLATPATTDPKGLQRRKHSTRSSTDEGSKENKTESELKDKTSLSVKDSRGNGRRESLMVAAGIPKGWEVQEVDRMGVLRRRWVEDGGMMTLAFPEANGSTINFDSVLALLKTSFLPVGFPHSVTDDYLAYQVYDSLQAFFSTLTSLLSNRALLEGLGVGDAGSSATNALLMTISQDAISRVATIAFAHKVGLAIEAEAKRYRFLADLCNDLAFFLDLLAPVVPGVFRVGVLAAAAALRAMCGVAGGASKVALSGHFAKGGNAGELNAKEGSQETAVGLVGLVVGGLLVQVVTERRAVWWVMVGLVVGHLGMNYLGVRAVRLRVLNRERVGVVYGEYLRTGKVMGPREVGGRETVVFWRPVVENWEGRPVAKVGFVGGWRELMPRGSSTGRRLPGVSTDAQFDIWVHDCGESELFVVKIMLKEGATPRDSVYAWTSVMDWAWNVDGRVATDPVYRVGRLFTEVAEPLSEVKKKAADGRKGAAGREEWWREAEEAGWRVDLVTMETEVPVRLRVVEGKGKGE